MLSEQGVQLLTLAQAGDRIAEEQLIILIRDTYMRRRIGKYLNKNRQVENDDIVQEFLIGVGRSISKANLDVGDPIEYLIAQGIYGVRNYFRKHVMQNTTQICLDCGRVSRLHRVNNKYVCKTCGSTNIETRELNDHDETIFNTIESMDKSEEKLIAEMLMEEFEKTLTPDTKVYDIYILLKRGITRDNPQVKNYIKEISRSLGGCSEQNVVQNLDKLKTRLQRFAKDNNMQIKDGIFIIMEDK